MTPNPPTETVSDKPKYHIGDHVTHKYTGVYGAISWVSPAFSVTDQAHYDFGGLITIPESDIRLGSAFDKKEYINKLKKEIKFWEKSL